MVRKKEIEGNEEREREEEEQDGNQHDDSRPLFQYWCGMVAGFKTGSWGGCCVTLKNSWSNSRSQTTASHCIETLIHESSHCYFHMESIEVHTHNFLSICTHVKRNFFWPTVKFQIIN